MSCEITDSSSVLVISLSMLCLHLDIYGLFFDLRWADLEAVSAVQTMLLFDHMQHAVAG
ncbi:MAG: hypothetical protein K5881_11310 [Saccharofermentans sp.]|nr:hypothetical protein [Saccharofermentans sp.]